MRAGRVFLLDQVGVTSAKKPQRAMRVFCLPADLEREERGVPPWSGCALCPNWLRIRGSPTARLPLRGLAVVTLRAQRTEPVERVRLGDPLRHQLTPRLGEVVSDRRCTPAQQTPRVPVQVRLTDALPPCGVAPFVGRTALLLGLAPMLGTAPARGQFGAPGYRARGAGLTRHGGHQHQGRGCPRPWSRPARCGAVQQPQQPPQRRAVQRPRDRARTSHRATARAPPNSVAVLSWWHEWHST